jgi:hypothetical protein
MSFPNRTATTLAMALAALFAAYFIALPIIPPYP